MATDKQVKYVQSLQEQYGTDDYTKKEIRNMSYNEISNVINELKKSDCRRILLYRPTNHSIQKENGEKSCKTRRNSRHRQRLHLIKTYYKKLRKC